MSARILIGRTSNRHGDFMMSIQRRESKSAGWFSSSKFSASNFLNICATILLMVVAQPSFADSQLSTALVRLENVRISAGDIGDDAQVRFLIFNNGHTPLHLRGISSLVAKSSRFEIEISNKKHVTAELLSIPADETLNFQTFHQRIFLSRLTKKLVPGQEIDIKFHFLKGDLDAVAHVH